MRFAVNVPNFGALSDPRVAVTLAQEAEAAGWDGFFIWDHVLWLAPMNRPVAEPWVTLAAIAAATERIRLGPLVTPLPRRRPWQVARQAVTLDQLSGGRLTLGVGIGGDWFGDYSSFGESADDKTHGAQLDEALAILEGLWSGEAFSFAGEHYTISDAQFLPRPLQQPRIPIWVAGVWPGTKPFRRAARYDGVAPMSRTDGLLTPEEMLELRAYVQEHRTSEGPFDVVLHGPPLRDEQYAAYAAAGLTWYHVVMGEADDAEAARAWIRSGPPAGVAGKGVPSRSADDVPGLRES
jgi:alkanesulfonate monooxygenase SsuD/methylene tetrahydromethanopterin reductase-like flavin-dependent oxidoreductase (luciferase family)